MEFGIPTTWSGLLTLESRLFGADEESTRLSLVLTPIELLTRQGIVHI